MHSSQHAASQIVRRTPAHLLDVANLVKVAEWAHPQRVVDPAVSASHLKHAAPSSDNDQAAFETRHATCMSAARCHLKGHPSILCSSWSQECHMCTRVSRAAEAHEHPPTNQSPGLAAQAAMALAVAAGWPVGAAAAAPMAIMCAAHRIPVWLQCVGGPSNWP